MADETISTRERLLRTAATLICQRGIERVNSNQIARAAGVGVGTFYKHFADKQTLRAALVVRGVEALGRHLAERLAVAQVQGIEQEVRAHATALVEFAALEPELFRVAFGPEAASRGTAGRPGVGYSTRALERRLAALQSRARLEPGLQPALAARAVGAMQTGLVCWWLDDPSRARADDLVATLVSLHPAVSCARSD